MTISAGLFPKMVIVGGVLSLDSLFEETVEKTLAVIAEMSWLATRVEDGSSFGGTTTGTYPSKASSLVSRNLPTSPV